jgi:hypothetical protein
MRLRLRCNFFNVYINFHFFDFQNVLAWLLRVQPVWPFDESEILIEIEVSRRSGRKIL